MASGWSAGARKDALDRARWALRSGNEEDLRMALQMLPSTGAKALGLKALILEALGESVGYIAAQEMEMPIASWVTEGRTYTFSIVSMDSSAAFDYRQRGERTEILVNRDHPFASLEVEAALQNKALQVLLIGLVNLELRSIDADKAAQYRTDLGRCMRSYLSSEASKG